MPIRLAAPNFRPPLRLGSSQPLAALIPASLLDRWRLGLQWHERHSPWLHGCQVDEVRLYGRDRLSVHSKIELLDVEEGWSYVITPGRILQTEVDNLSDEQAVWLGYVNARALQTAYAQQYNRQWMVVAARVNVEPWTMRSANGRSPSVVPPFTDYALAW